jgi:HlyD family secretion protein
MKKWIAIVALLVVVAGAGLWKSKSTAKLDFGAKPEPRPATAVASIASISFAVSSAGDIGPADQVSVRPEINGKIMELRVDIGDVAKKGSLLFSLDDTDLQNERSSTETQIDGSKLQVEKTQRNYLRAENLFKDKLISQEVYEDAKTEYDLARNSLERTQKALDLIDYKLTKTKIAAPFDCTVLTRPVSIGQAVSGSGGYNSGTEVLTIANLNEMIVNAHINQADVTRMKLHQAVEMEVEAVPGLKLKGTIDRIAPQATIRNGIKGFATRILLTTIDQRVRPGMTANISIPVASAEKVTSVPLAAVFSEMGDHYVWVVREEGKALRWERRSVKTGVADYSLVEIQSGLQPGETVALEQPSAKVLDGIEKGAGEKKSALTNVAPKAIASSATAMTPAPKQ